MSANPADFAPTAALRRLRELIEEERSVILSNNGQRLDEITAAKTSALKSVEGLLTMLKQGREPPGLAAQKPELNQLLRQCDEANRANGALLHMRAARNRAALSTSGGTGGYGPQSSSGRGSTLGRVLARA